MAETLQLMLMDLSLEQVAVLSACNQPPPSILPVPVLLVSSVDDVSISSHDQAADHQSCDRDLGMPTGVDGEQTAYEVEGEAETQRKSEGTAH